MDEWFSCVGSILDSTRQNLHSQQASSPQRATDEYPSTYRASSPYHNNHNHNIANSYTASSLSRHLVDDSSAAAMFGRGASSASSQYLNASSQMPMYQVHAAVPSWREPFPYSSTISHQQQQPQHFHSNMMHTRPHTSQGFMDSSRNGINNQEWNSHAQYAADYNNATNSRGRSHSSMRRHHNRRDHSPHDSSSRKKKRRKSQRSLSTAGNVLHHSRNHSNKRARSAGVTHSKRKSRADEDKYSDDADHLRRDKDVSGPRTPTRHPSRNLSAENLSPHASATKKRGKRRGRTFSPPPSDTNEEDSDSVRLEADSESQSIRSFPGGHPRNHHDEDDDESDTNELHSSLTQSESDSPSDYRGAHHSVPPPSNARNPASPIPTAASFGNFFPPSAAAAATVNRSHSSLGFSNPSTSMQQNTLHDQLVQHQFKSQLSTIQQKLAALENKFLFEFETRTAYLQEHSTKVKQQSQLELDMWRQQQKKSFNEMNEEFDRQIERCKYEWNEKMTTMLASIREHSEKERHTYEEWRDELRDIKSQISGMNRSHEQSKLQMSNLQELNEQKISSHRDTTRQDISSLTSQISNIQKELLDKMQHMEENTSDFVKKRWDHINDHIHQVIKDSISQLTKKMHLSQESVVDEARSAVYKYMNEYAVQVKQDMHSETKTRIESAHHALEMRLKSLEQNILSENSVTSQDLELVRKHVDVKTHKMDETLKYYTEQHENDMKDTSAVLTSRFNDFEKRMKQQIQNQIDEQKRATTAFIQEAEQSQSLVKERLTKLVDGQQEQQEQATLLESLQSSLSSLQSELRQMTPLKDKVNLLQDKMKQFDEDHTSIVSIKNQLTDFSGVEDRLSKRLNALQDDVVTKLASSQAEENSTATTTASVTNSEIEQLRQQCDLFSTQIKSIRSQSEQIQTQMHDQTSQMKQQMSTLESKLAQANVQGGNDALPLTKQIQKHIERSLKKENKALVKRLDALETKQQSLEEQNEQLHQELAEYKKHGPPSQQVASLDTAQITKPASPEAHIQDAEEVSAREAVNTATTPSPTNYNLSVEEEPKEMSSNVDQLGNPPSPPPQEPEENTSQHFEDVPPPSTSLPELPSQSPPDEFHSDAQQEDAPKEPYTDAQQEDALQEYHTDAQQDDADLDEDYDALLKEMDAILSPTNDTYNTKEDTPEEPNEDALDQGQETATEDLAVVHKDSDSVNSALNKLSSEPAEEEESDSIMDDDSISKLIAQSESILKDYEAKEDDNLSEVDDDFVAEMGADTASHDNLEQHSPKEQPSHATDEFASSNSPLHENTTSSAEQTKQAVPSPSTPKQEEEAELYSISNGATPRDDDSSSINSDMFYKNGRGTDDHFSQNSAIEDNLSEDFGHDDALHESTPQETTNTDAEDVGSDARDRDSGKVNMTQDTHSEQQDEQNEEHSSPQPAPSSPVEENQIVEHEDDNIIEYDEDDSIIEYDTGNETSANMTQDTYSVVNGSEAGSTMYNDDDNDEYDIVDGVKEEEYEMVDGTKTDDDSSYPIVDDTKSEEYEVVDEAKDEEYDEPSYPTADEDASQDDQHDEFSKDDQHDEYPIVDDTKSEEYEVVDEAKDEEYDEPSHPTTDGDTSQDDNHNQRDKSPIVHDDNSMDDNYDTVDDTKPNLSENSFDKDSLSENLEDHVPASTLQNEWQQDEPSLEDQSQTENQQDSTRENHATESNASHVSDNDEFNVDETGTNEQTTPIKKKQPAEDSFADDLDFSDLEQMLQEDNNQDTEDINALVNEALEEDHDEEIDPSLVFGGGDSAGDSLSNLIGGEFDDVALDFANHSALVAGAGAQDDDDEFDF